MTTSSMFRRDKPNRIDALADELRRAGKIASLETELEKFSPRRLKGAERESWFHLRGVLAFQRGDHATAFARFQEARQAVPDSGSIAFSLAQEQEFRGEIDEMFALFDLFRFPSIPASYGLAQARYAYLWGAFARGISYVEPILEAHFRLQVADDTFLYLRRMPFFSQTWAYLAALAELLGDLGVVQDQTDRAKAILKDYDV